MSTEDHPLPPAEPDHPEMISGERVEGGLETTLPPSFQEDGEPPPNPPEE
jgi:hypothetical protein